VRAGQSTGTGCSIRSVVGMTTLSQKLSTSPARPASRRRTVVTLVAAIAIAVLASGVIALAATASGATAFPPLMPQVFGAFAAVGVLGAYAGWRIVRARSLQPRRMLRVLVPVLLVLSFIPDVTLLITGFIPGTTTTGALALMLMHLVVVGVAVPVSQRLAPV
jgi:hypothetical protein